MKLINNLTFSVILCGVVFFFLLWGIKKMLFHLLEGKRSHRRITFYFPIFQYILWVMFIAYMIFQVAHSGPFVILAFVGIFILLGYQFLQNFFLGVFFRLENGDLRDSSIAISNQEGIIISFEMTAICLKSDIGNYTYIPYERLYKKGFIHTVKEQFSGKQSLKVFLEKKEELSQEEIASIRKKIYLNPYIAGNESIQIVTGQEEGLQWILLSYTLANSERADYVKQALQEEITVLLN